jgi:hypothetical protein
MLSKQEFNDFLFSPSPAVFWRPALAGSALREPEATPAEGAGEVLINCHSICYYFIPKNSLNL